MGIISKTIKPLFYSKKEKRHELVGPPKLWKMKQEFQIAFLKDMGLNPNQTLLDIGCGTLRGGIPIIEYLDESSYFGIDVREENIQEGLKELQDEGLENKKPTVRSFDTFPDLELGQKFNVMFAFSVLIHMADDISAACLKFVSENLDENGVFYANVNFGDREDGIWRGFPIVFRSMEFYSNMAKQNGLKIESIGTLKELGHLSGSELGDSQVMLKFTFA